MDANTSTVTVDANLMNALREQNLSLKQLLKSEEQYRKLIQRHFNTLREQNLYLKELLKYEEQKSNLIQRQLVILLKEQIESYTQINELENFCIDWLKRIDYELEKKKKKKKK